MFHAVASAAADLFVGTPTSEAARKAWVAVYRSAGHATIRKACANTDLKNSLPQQIAIFAMTFELMQTKRHRADYDPFAAFSHAASLIDINNVEQAIVGLASASETDMRIFLAHAFFKSRAG